MMMIEKPFCSFHGGPSTSSRDGPCGKLLREAHVEQFFHGAESISLSSSLSVPSCEEKVKSKRSQDFIHIFLVMKVLKVHSRFLNLI